MISKKSYIADGNTNRFLSDFIIRSSQFARPYIYIYDNTLPSDGTGDILVDGSINQADWSYPDNIWKRGANAPASFDLVTVDKWQVVDNSILFYTNPVMGSTIWVEVATTADEFGETLAQPSVEKAEEAALQAQNSAASASASATTSSAGASSASASAANAATSEANALVSENNAKTSELNALVSENNAATSETNASVSETNASTSESNAATSEANVAVMEETVVSKEALVSPHYDAIDTIAANSTDVSVVAGSIVEVTTVSNSIDDVSRYADTYYPPSETDPSTRPDGSATVVGDMYLNTSSDASLKGLRLYDTDGWRAAGTVINGTSVRQVFTATAEQTTFNITGGYDAGFADVYLNGRKLENGVDVDTSSGADIVLAVGASAGDIVDVVAYGAFVLDDHYTKSEDDQLLDTKAGLNGSATQTFKVADAVNADEAVSKAQMDSGLGNKADKADVIGINQTWQNVLASRSDNVTYTNSTGKPIMVVVSYNASSNGIDEFYVNGVKIASNVLPDGEDITMTFIVPDGDTYKANTSNSFRSWFELR